MKTVAAFVEPSNSHICRFLRRHLRSAYLQLFTEYFTLTISNIIDITPIGVISIKICQTKYGLNMAASIAPLARARFLVPKSAMSQCGVLVMEEDGERRAGRRWRGKEEKNRRSRRAARREGRREEHEERRKRRGG